MSSGYGHVIKRERPISHEAPKDLNNNDICNHSHNYKLSDNKVQSNLYKPKSFFEEMRQSSVMSDGVTSSTAESTKSQSSESRLSLSSLSQ